MDEAEAAGSTARSGIRGSSSTSSSRQWRSLRDSCRRRNIDLIGDLPIYVADDSADVWARPDLFHLDISGRPTVVAGVPPDLFSPEFGQRWGNPLYRWEAHKAEHYAWWFSRIRASIERVDLVRLDHFRGFEAYWEVPASSPSAALGRWVEAPGADFLAELREHLGGLPLVAEDLGVITDKVEKLRDDFGLPGMKILQFGFGAERRTTSSTSRIGTSRIASSTRGRTTTTRPSAGTT